MWVGGVRTDDGRKEVLYTLEVAGVQRPALLPVAGAPPGLLLRFASPLLVPPALVALRTRIGGPTPATASATMPAMLAPHEVSRALPRGPAADVGPRTLWVGQVREPAAYVPGGVLADVHMSRMYSAQTFSPAAFNLRFCMISLPQCLVGSDHSVLPCCAAADTQLHCRSGRRYQRRS